MHRAGTLLLGPGSRLLAIPTHCLRSLALPLCLLAFPHPSPAQSLAQPGRNLLLADALPAAPGFLPPDPIGVGTGPGTISGTVTDRDGATIAGASITLTPDPQPPADGPRVAVSTPDGRFSIPDVPPGLFKITVAAAGFAPLQTSGELHAGESIVLPAIALAAASNTDIQVTASQSEIAEAQINDEEKQRVLAVFPNFYVSYVADPVPLDPKQKFELALRTFVDPVSFVLNGVTAGVEQANNTYSWGQGAQGYTKRYFAGYGTFLTDTLLGNAVLPILFKQDPRYFYKGTGSIRSRILYAVATSVVCKGDNRRWQPDYSSILGGLAAGGISNFYYPAANRSGAALTFEGAAIGTGFTAVTNLLQEFVVRRLTPHIAAPAPHAPAPK
jgi:hypothetical protein